MAAAEIHPIVFLWCHPRSMSTAMERVMRERGDLICFHEPFMYDYYVHRRVAHMPHFQVNAEHPASYGDIRGMILESAETSPVFVKDMSYYVVPGIFEDEEFARRITHSFLIRNPMHSILSYFKLDSAVTVEEIGLEAQWKHAVWLADRLSVRPLVLTAESVRRNPRSVITDYWRRLGLDLREEALGWDTGSAPAEWHNVSGWHGSVSRSKGIRRHSDVDDGRRREEFQSMAEREPRLADLLAYHLPFYESLKGLAI